MVKLDADTIQPSLFINLNSDEADISISSSNKIFKVNNLIEALDTNQIVMTLWDSIVPNSFYNVNQYYNTILYNNASTNKTLTIPDGYYDSDLILSTIQTLLRNSDNYNTTNVLVTLSELTNKISIDSGSSNTMKIIGGTLIKRLGLDVGFFNTRIINAQSIMNIVGSPYLNVKFNNISTNNLDSQGHRNDVLGCIPIDDSFGSWIHYHDSGGRHNILSTNFISTLHIEITDSNNNPIDFNGLSWKLTLSIHFIKKKTHDFKRIEF